MMRGATLDVIIYKGPPCRAGCKMEMQECFVQKLSKNFKVVAAEH